MAAQDKKFYWRRASGEFSPQLIRIVTVSINDFVIAVGIIIIIMSPGVSICFSYWLYVI